MMPARGLRYDWCDSTDEGAAMGNPIHGLAVGHPKFMI